LFTDWDEEFLDLYVQYGMVEQTTGGLRLTCSPEKETSLFMGEMKYNPWPLLAKISCPTLVIEDEKNLNRYLIDLKVAAAKLPQGSYRLVAAAGHLIPMEKPKEIIQITADFLRSF
jgi:pimeloyl-ACP methyl ester carboxylesterase